MKNGGALSTQVGLKPLADEAKGHSSPQGLPPAQAALPAAECRRGRLPGAREAERIRPLQKGDAAGERENGCARVDIELGEQTMADSAD